MQLDGQHGGLVSACAPNVRSGSRGAIIEVNDTVRLVGGHLVRVVGVRERAHVPGETALLDAWR